MVNLLRSSGGFGETPVWIHSRVCLRASLYTNKCWCLDLDQVLARIVADGLGFTNRCVLDEGGRWLYGNENFARRLSPFAWRRMARLPEGKQRRPSATARRRGRCSGYAAGDHCARTANIRPARPDCELAPTHAPPLPCTGLCDVLCDVGGRGDTFHLLGSFAFAEVPDVFHQCLDLLFGQRFSKRWH